MKKIDIWEMLWKPRLAFSYIFSALKGIGKKKDRTRRYLPMEEMCEDQGYPRPQFVRKSFFSLDGEWLFSRQAEGEKIPGSFDERIRVPFPPQTHRSGIDGDAGDFFWYKKDFTLPESFSDDRVILHFEAVDQIATVFVNGLRAGRHEGGFLPFSFDITGYLHSGENSLCVYVEDELDPRLPYGKQSKKPGEMWYGQISGIWRSVWMESVPDGHVSSVRCIYKEKRGGVMIQVDGTADEYDITVYRPVMRREADESRIVEKRRLKKGLNFIPLSDIRLWSVDTPWLYFFDISTGRDVVRSYFALRTVGVELVDGRERLCLNHRPFFFHAVLDQGYYSDGLMTPVNYRYYEQDILRMKELGFNALRKHLKVESARFYYDCDRLGMAVMQDMVNNGDYNYLRDTVMPTVFPFYVGHYKKDSRFRVDRATAEFFVTHSRQTQKYLFNFPCILYYTIFNEGWGQFNSDRVLKILKKGDPTRIYDSASGWYKQKGTDIESIHCYFHKVPVVRWKKPAVISEFGGFSMSISGHTAFSHKGFGYGEVRGKDRLTDRIVRMYREEIIPYLSWGICGTVYTQLSDVEEEINGLYTYDRAVCKVDVQKLRELSLELLEAAGN